MAAIQDHFGSNFTSNDYISFAEPLLLFMFYAKKFSMNISLPCRHVGHDYSFIFSSSSEKIFTIEGNKTTTSTCVAHDKTFTQIYSEGIVNESIDVELHGKLLGITKLRVEILGPDINEWSFKRTQDKVETSDIEIPSKSGKTNQYIAFPVTVLRNIRLIDKIFMGLMTVFLFLITLGFGCKLDLGIVKECLKKPVAPGIGFGCQYIVMPLVSSVGEHNTNIVKCFQLLL